MPNAIDAAYDAYVNSTNDISAANANLNTVESSIESNGRPARTPLDKLLEASKQSTEVAEAGSQSASQLLESFAVQDEQQKQKEDNLGIFGKLLFNDETKVLAGGAVRGTGSIVDGAGYLLEQVNKLPGADYNPLLSQFDRNNTAINNLLDGKGIKEAAKSLIGLNKPDKNSASSTIQDIGNQIKDAGETVSDAISGQGQRDIRRSTPTGDIFNLDEGVSFGSAPSASGYKLQMLGILGEFAPQAVGLIPKGAASLIVSSAVGFTQAGAEAGDDAYDYINNTEHDVLAKDSPTYQKLIDKGVSPDDAKEQTAQLAKGVAFATGGTIGAAGGAASSFILKSTGLNKILSGGVGKKVAATTIGSGVEEGAQEALEPIAARAAVNAAVGTDRSLTEDSFANVVLGGSFGSALGTAGGVKNIATNAKDNIKAKAIEANENKVAADKAREVAKADVAESIASDDVNNLINRSKRNALPINDAVSALNEIATTSTDEGKKSEAVDKLATLENEINEELAFIEKLKENPEQLNKELSEQLASTKEVSSKAKQLLETKTDLAPEQKEALENAIKGNEESVATIEDQIERYSNQTPAQLESEYSSALANVKAFRNVAPKATSDVPSTSSETITKAAITPFEVTESELQSLASNPQSTPKEIESANNLINIRKNEEGVKNFVDVNGEIDNIFNSNNQSSNKSIQAYRASIGAAIQSGNLNTAKSELEQLSKFQARHSNKAEQARLALSKAEPGKQQVLLFDKESGKYTHRENSKGITGFLTDAKAKAQGALTISHGSKGLVETIESEAQVLSGSLKALEEAIQESEATTTDSNSNGTQDIEEVIRSIEESSSSNDSQPSESNSKDSSENSTVSSAQKSSNFSSSNPKIQELSNLFIDGPNGKEANLKSVIEWAGTNASPATKILLRKYYSHPLVQTLGNVSSDTTPIGLNTQHDNKDAGRYNPNNHTISIDVSKVNNIGNGVDHLVNTVGHELTHAISYNLLRTDIKFNDAITNLREEVRTWANNNKNNVTDGTALRYALQNNDEFLAVALNNTSVQSDLAKIKSKKSNVYSEFVSSILNAIKSALNLSTGESTVLERVLAASDYAITNTSTTDIDLGDTTNKTEKLPHSEEVTSTNTPQQQTEEISEDLTGEISQEQSQNSPQVGSENASENVSQLNLSTTQNDSPIDPTELDHIYDIDIDDLFDPNDIPQDFNLGDFNAEIDQQASELAEADIAIAALELDEKLSGVNTEALSKGESTLGFTKQDQEVIEGPITNEQLKTVNKVAAYFNANKPTPLNKIPNYIEGIVQRGTISLSALTPYIRGGEKRIRAASRKGTPVKLIQEFYNTHSDWSPKLDALHGALPASRQQFRHEKPLNYFTNSEGRLDPVVKDAIIYGAFNFISKTGNGLYFNNKDSQLRAILDLEDSDEIPDDKRKALEKAGSSVQTVHNEIGSDIYQALGLNINSTTPQNEKEQIKGALGTIATALLVDEGLLEYNDIPSSVFNDNTDNELQVAIFVRSARTPEVENSRLKELSEITKGSSGLLSDLFSGDFAKPRATLKPVKTKQVKAKNSSRNVPSNLINRINKKNKEKYELNTSLVNGKDGMLDLLGRDFLAVLGGLDTRDPDLIHKDNRDSVVGSNEAIEREVEQIYDHISEVLEDDASKPFYFQNNVKKQQRVHIDADGFNPLNNKIQRFLSGQKVWEYNVDPLIQDENSDGFKLSVLESLGIAADSGRDTTLLPEFDVLADDPVYAAGIEAIQQLLDPDSELTPDDLEALKAPIQAATKQGGEKVHSFAGLVELARYQNAITQGTTFTSALMREGDGKTNGPMLANMQYGLTGSETDAGIMAMGGFFTKGSKFKNYGEYAEDVGLDLYKIMSKDAIIASEFKLTEDEIKKGVRKGTPEEVTLVDLVAGNLYEKQEREEGGTDITITSSGRKLAKGPITQVVYGAGVNKTIDNLGYQFYEAFLSKIESLAGEGDKEGVKQLIIATNLLLPKGQKIKRDPAGTYINTDFTEAQQQAISNAMINTFGRGMKKAIAHRFGRLTENRNAMNLANNVSVGIYQAVYNARKRKIIAERAVTDQPAPVNDLAYVYDLTAQEEKQLNALMEPMAPALATAQSKAVRETNAGISLLKKVKSKFEDSGSIRGKVDFSKKVGNGGKNNAGIKSITFAGTKDVFKLPGASGAVILNQSTDAAIAMSSSQDALNVHDAAAKSTKDMAETMRNYNQNTYSALANHSHAESSMDNYFNILDQYELIKDQFKDDPDFHNELEFIDRGQDYEDMPFELVGELLLSKLEVGHSEKLRMLANMQYVDQYYVEGGVYEVTENQQKAMQKRADKESLRDLVQKKRRASDLNRGNVGAEQSLPNVRVGTGGFEAPLPSLASNPQPDLPKYTQYTTNELFNKLNEGNPLTASKKKYLGKLLNDLTGKLYGPLGPRAQALKASIGQTAQDLYAHQVKTNTFAGAANSLHAGIKLTDAERFALDQIETTTKEALDGGSLQDKGIIKVFNETKKRLNSDGREFFEGSDWGKASAEEKANAKNIYDYIFKLSASPNNAVTDRLAKFTALGLTYEPLRKAMEFNTNQVPVSQSDKLGDRLQHLFDLLVHWVANKLNNTQADQRADVRLEQLVNKLVQNEAKRQQMVNSKIKDLSDQLEEYSIATGKQGRKLISNIATSDVVSNSSVHVKAIGNLVSHVADERIDKFVETLEDFRNKEIPNQVEGFAKSVISEVRGETPENTNMFKALREMNKIEQDRKRAKDTLSAQILQQFENPDDITQQQGEAITQLFIRNDMAALVETYGYDKISDFILDPDKRDKEIKILTNRILEDKHGSNYMKDAEYTAYFMATGKNTSDHLYKNIHLLARQAGTKNAKRITENHAKAMEPLLNELTSLLALKHTDPRHLRYARKLIAEETARKDSSGLRFVISKHAQLQADAQRDLFHDNPSQMIKGYVKEIFNPYNEVLVGTEKDINKLEKEGYSLVSELERDGSDPDDHKKRFLFTLKGVSQPGRITGAWSYTGASARGTLIHGSASVNSIEGIAKWKQGRVNGILSQKLDSRESSSEPKYSLKFDPSQRKAGKLAPVFNAAGEVANYQYLMTHAVKDNLIGRDNNFANVLGSTLGSQIDKISSKKHNRDVTQSLKEFYDEDFKKNPAAYVELSLSSPNQSLVNTYRLLPDALKKDIKEIWGEDKIFIRNDFIDLITGYRKISVSDPFGQDPNVRGVMQDFLVKFVESMLGKGAAAKVRKSEDMWQSTVKLIKDTLVIRNLYTLLGNLRSNVSLLMWEGVSIKDMSRGHVEAAQGLVDYQKKQSQLELLQNKLGTNVPQEGLEEQIEEIQSEMARNPVHTLIEEGLFQTIQEDVDLTASETAFKSPFDSAIDNQLDKLPKVVRTVGEHLAVSPDTPIYKVLSKSTQMSDFIGRYVLYQHITTRSKNPMSHDDAIVYVSNAFVNYDAPTNKHLQFLNDNGLLMFTKYYLRIQPKIYQLMKDKPARGLAIAMAANYLNISSTLGESSLITKDLGNPLDDGALGIFGVLDQPAPINFLFNLFK